MFQFPPINYLYLVACLLAIALIASSRTAGHNLRGRLWLGVLIGFALWTGGEFIANLGTTLAWQLAWQRLVYLGVITGVCSWLFFALCHTGLEHWVTRRTVPLLLTVPLVSLLMVMTLEWHSLLYRSVSLGYSGDFRVLQPEYGLGFWLLTLTCTHLYALAGSGLLLRHAVLGAQVYRGQSLLLAAAALTPVLPNLLYIAGVQFAGGYDPTSLFFIFSAILVTIATQRYHFLSLTPIARARVFETMPMAVAVTDRSHRVVDLNPAFGAMLGVPGKALPGQLLDTMLASYFTGPLPEPSASPVASARLQRLGDGALFDVSLESIVDQAGQPMGCVWMFNDVTAMQQALDQLSQLANTDQLTSLPNRRAMEQLLSPDQPDLWHSSETQVHVIVADVDHFKRLNDAYGHAFGDLVLRELAQLMRDNLRPQDRLWRWGGEEFCMLLENVERAQAAEIIERLRLSIAARAFLHAGREVHLTMTFGMTAMRPGETADQALQRADQRMYEGKRRGRNCVVAGDND